MAVYLPPASFWNIPPLLHYIDRVIPQHQRDDLQSAVRRFGNLENTLFNLFHLNSSTVASRLLKFPTAFVLEDPWFTPHCAFLTLSQTFKPTISIKHHPIWTIEQLRPTQLRQLFPVLLWRLALIPRPAAPLARSRPTPHPRPARMTRRASYLTRPRWMLPPTLNKPSRSRSRIRVLGVLRGGRVLVSRLITYRFLPAQRSTRRQSIWKSTRRVL